MPTPRLRHSFSLFYVTLGIVLLLLSAQTAFDALIPGRGHGNPHVALLGGVEMIGAILFLLPRTFRLGGWLLLGTIGVAMLFHAAIGQFRGDLLIYASATWFVMVHGPAWSARPAGASPA